MSKLRDLAAEEKLILDNKILIFVYEQKIRRGHHE